MATQEQIDSYIDAFVAAGITAEQIIAAVAGAAQAGPYIAGLIDAGIGPEDLALFMQRAEASLNVSRAALAILAHDAETATVTEQRATARADLVTAMEAAQTAFVALGE